MDKRSSLVPRIEIIDALRGFTLLGILITHTIDQYYAGLQPEQYAGLTTSTIIDAFVSRASLFIISDKFFMIFSFLFGLGFYIQLSKAKGDVPFLLKFFWRLVILFVIGLVHHLHYRGDVLTTFAMLGIFLLITYRLPDKYLLAISLILVFDVPGILTRIFAAIGNDQTINDLMRQDETDVLEYYYTFESGTYLELMKANIESFRLKLGYQIWTGRIYKTPGLFLFGLYAGRKGFFEQIPAHLPMIKKYLKLAAVCLLVCIVSRVAFSVIGKSMVGGFSDEVNTAVTLTFWDLFNSFLGTIYVLLFILLFQKEKWRNGLLHFYEAGRMGLTTYLMQAFFGVLIFSTLGMGLLGEMGAAACFVIAIAIFILQVWISKIWLKYFYYGPVEWLWRGLTDFNIPPLLKVRASPEIVMSRTPK